MRTPRSRMVLAGAIGVLSCARETPAPAVSRSERPEAPPSTEAGDRPTASSPQPVATIPAPAPVAADVSALRIDTPAGWSAQYNVALESWTVQRDASGSATAAPADRFYVDAFPPDVPTDLNAYADALESDPQFQDAGYLFVTIERKQVVDGGWLIVGASKDTSDEESEGSPSFVLLREALGVYCHSGTFVDAKSRDDAIEICVGIRPGSAAAARP